MPTSSYETLTRRFLAAMFPRVYWQERVRPDWLRNPATGQRLEIDFYHSPSKTGIEVQGPGHYRDVAGMSDPVHAEAQRQRDTVKRARCAEHGVLLVELSIFHLADVNRLYSDYSLLSVRLGLTMMPRYQFEQHADIQAIVKDAGRLARRPVKPHTPLQPRSPSLWRRIQGLIHGGA